MSNKTVIISIPKSGTYLTKEILVNSGLVWDPRHISQAWDGVLEVQGDFRIGHPSYQDTALKTVFLHRNLRDVIISSLRFDMRNGRKQAVNITPKYLQLYFKYIGKLPIKMPELYPWYEKADKVYSFEDLHSPTFIAELVTFVRETECTLEEAQSLLDRSYNKRTLTWTGDTKRTDWRDYWDKDVEKMWRQTPFYEFNKLLGYYGTI